MDLGTEFTGVRYNGVLYNLQGRVDDKDMFLRNYPHTPGALNEDGEDEYEIRLYLKIGKYRNPKARANSKITFSSYRFAYLAHFFYLGHDKNIDKKVFFRSLCPESVFSEKTFNEAAFVRNVMDVLCAVCLFYGMQAITLQDEATNANGFPLCENRFRAPTYVGTYEKYGFIRQEIKYADNGNKGDRSPDHPLSIEDAVQTGNTEIHDDLVHSTEPAQLDGDDYVSGKRKRDKLPVTTKSTLIDKTLEQVVADFYDKLKLGQKPDIVPPPCYGGRVKYIDHSSDGTVRMVAFQDMVNSTERPRGHFFIQTSRASFTLDPAGQLIITTM